MKIKFEIKKIKDVKTEAVASFTFEDSRDSKLQWLNTLFKSELATLIESNDFKGSIGETTMAYINADIKAKRLLIAGLGNSKEITLEKLRIAYAAAAKRFNKLKLNSGGFEVPDLALIKSVVNYSVYDIMQAIAEGVLLSQYQVKRYTEKSDFKPLEEIVFFTDSPKFTKEINDIVKDTRIIYDAVSMARDLGNEPSNSLYPDRFAEMVRKSSIKAGYSVTVYDEKKIKQLGMGGLSGVAQGSANPPRFLILQFFGSSKSEKPVVLVGKGVTFDSGGISIKPAQGMEAMKMDMCGAAAVVGAFEAVSRLKLRVNVIGLIPCTENMPSGTAIKPGDIIKSYNGMTIEVDNTDAEGRLILADALGYASNYKPKAVIDVATLTGAAVVCFGNTVAGVMGNDAELIKKIFNAGEKTYERVWELPLYDEYAKLMKSDMADIKNIGIARKAGTILGGIFLKKFVEDKYTWAHLDIAGTAFGITDPPDYMAPGATGYGVRLFVELLKSFQGH
jgi:leucyl aminopeptidase